MLITLKYLIQTNSLARNLNYIWCRTERIHRQDKIIGKAKG